MDTKIIAHRGASGLVEFDNSIESFKKAIEIGSDMVEFDVRKTRDDILIAFHDLDLKGQKIAELEYEEILEITEDAGYKVPTVEDVVVLCKGKIGLDVELKESGYEKELVDLLTDHLDREKFIMKSFSDKTVRSIKEYDDNIKTGLLLGVENPKRKLKTRLSELFPKKRVRDCKADFVSPNHQLLRLFFLRRMRFSGKDVYVWTVNDPVKMIHLFGKKVRAIITDRPDLAIKVRNSLR